MNKVKLISAIDTFDLEKEINLWMKQDEFVKLQGTFFKESHISGNWHQLIIVKDINHE